MPLPVQQKSALNVVMGAMTFGEPGKEGTRVHETRDIEAILDVFISHGHSEVDTARIYGDGTSEEYLGKIDLEGKGLKVETKLYPTTARSAKIAADKITHTPEGLRTYLMKSLKSLNVESLEMWYLHAPDRNVPYEVTMKAVNDLYNEKYFKRFGLSNYSSWEVAEIVQICKANGYVQPSAYQGIYNALHRSVEPELFPCLRKYGISFYAFSPLAGGFFTERYTSMTDEPEKGSRFDPQRIQGQSFRGRYWSEPYFKAANEIRAVAQKYNLTLPEIALRWMSHHSPMKREYGDSILIGASRAEHIKQNLLDLEKGPLPEEVVQKLDEAWLQIQAYAANYFH